MNVIFFLDLKCNILQMLTFINFLFIRSYYIRLATFVVFKEKKTQKSEHGIRKRQENFNRYNRMRIGSR